MPSLQSIVVKAHCGPTSRKVMNKGTQGGFQGKHAPYLAAVLAGNALASKIALADEALSVPEFSVPDVTGTALESSGISELFADNPLLIGGAALLVALPLGINAILKAGTEASGQVKPTSVENTYAALENDPRVILVDIRNRAEIKAQGSPDLRSVKRSAVSVPFTNVVKGEVEVNENFAAKFSTIKNISEESLVILFDADGSVAKTAAANISDMVAKAYYVQGGAETWAATGPWRAPSAGIKLPDLRSFGSSINNLAEDFKKAPTVGKAGIAAAAIAGAGVLIFNEAELVLEAVGALAGANFLFNLLLKEPEGEVKKLVEEKIGAKEIGSDLGKIADAIVEEPAVKEERKEEAKSAPAAKEEKKEEAKSAPASVTATASELPPAKEWIENWKAKSKA